MQNDQLPADHDPDARGASGIVGRVRGYWYRLCARCPREHGLGQAARRAEESLRREQEESRGTDVGKAAVRS